MKIVFATNNLNKFNEARFLMPQSITLLCLADISCNDDIPETQSTIEANAKQKAKYIYQKYGYNCFADDTGLEVEVLDGDPGVYSARYAGEQKNSNDNMAKLLLKLYNETNRTAQFKTVIGLFLNGNYHEFIGICKGEITKAKLGNNGFGYDPIFKPNDYAETFAEMNTALKNKIGHRGKAIQKLIEFLTVSL